MDYELDMYQAKAAAMDLHMERVMYTPWFYRDLSDFLGTLPDTRRIQVWLGDPGRFYLQPGTTKKYVTLVFRYEHHLIAYEQDSLNNRNGICRELIVPS
jgi:hypothetical protein